MEVLKGWFPALPWGFLAAWLPKAVEIFNRLGQPDQLEFELGALRVEIKARLDALLAEGGGA
jgi:hypothetical protein